MKKKSISFFMFFLSASVSWASQPERSGLSQAVSRFLQSHQRGPIKVWVYFSDHDEGSPADLEVFLARVVLSDRAMRRRINRSAGPLIDIHDLPVSPRYISGVRRTGCKVKNVSKYLNALSAEATRDQILALSRLPFVVEIDRVRTLHRKLPPAEDRFKPFAPGRIPPPAHRRAPEDTFYGESFKQLDLINVPPLHNLGVNGEGILVAMLDTGFNLHHVSLDHLPIVAEWDFINNDSITENEPGQDPVYQHDHGTYTLSALAGYAPGSLIGPAWKASFALAKTERVDMEIEAEEDDWVRAIEWADSLGAEVVSSSLGYFDWYTYEDMDGNTAVTTRAADIAASKGITVVTAAGNEGPLPWPGIIAPADGDSVIAVGAVDSSGVLAGFSSWGPTYDDRIKPDVVAQGVAVVSASAWDSLGFVRVGGTSLSTPLVAGSCALLLEMHPFWTPMDVLYALRSAASNSSSPDNAYGWGIINAYVSAMHGSTGVAGTSFLFRLVGRSLHVSIHISEAAALEVDLLRRRLDPNGGWDPFSIVEENILLSSLSPHEMVDEDLPGGVYQYRIQLHGDSTTYKDSQSVRIPYLYALRQSYPNPFVRSSSPTTRIEYTLGGFPPLGGEAPLSRYREISLSIHDVRGMRVKRLFEGIRPPGDHYYELWDGTDDRGSPVASGVYYCRLLVDGLSLSKKIVFLNR